MIDNKGNTKTGKNDMTTLWRVWSAKIKDNLLYHNRFKSVQK